MGDLSSFKKRLESFEANFAHNEKLEFRILALRNHRLGQWAADQMGLAGKRAEDYIDTIIELHVRAADKDVVRDKIILDFDSQRVEYSNRAISRKMEDLLAEARREIMADDESDS